MLHSQLFPTNFARKLADSVGLRDVGYDDVDQCLVNFQQMSMSASFEESLIAYHGVELTEQQRKALEIIYNSTIPWIKGHITGVLMTRLTEDKLSIRAAELALGIISGDSSDIDVNGMLVNLNIRKNK